MKRKRKKIFFFPLKFNFNEGMKILETFERLKGTKKIRFVIRVFPSSRGRKKGEKNDFPHRRLLPSFLATKKKKKNFQKNLMIRRNEISQPE